KVFDCDTDEEYVQVHLPIVGSFASKVREAYMELLEEIAENCYEDAVFLLPQSNRIIDLVRERYDEQPDFPFDSIGAAVLRYPQSRKWYAIIMAVSRNKLVENAGEEEVEVMNVKIDTDKREEYLAIDGIYPGYHMNREKWLSIILDDTVDDQIIMNMIDESRQFAMKGAKKNTSSAWIVPANPAYYDLDTLFQKKKGVMWTQGNGIRKGDIVYMYIAAPVSAVRYKCKVTETDIPYEFSNEKIKMKGLMKMDVLKQYPDELCPFSRLKELGISAVRGPRRVTREFSDFIDRQ
ncbi:MAG: MmcQ/YjbR family DNA-binding protein, partial [Erysipelotrichaceae bacterium]|nr:MmcQ/YjbR family DNA-binding protein [Erysipelotrichaceae bacterium]